METDRYNLLKNKFSDICYVKECNNFGNICVNAKDIIIKTIKKNSDDFLNYLDLVCKEALKLSKKYNNENYCAHIYLGGVTMKNFSLKLFRKVINALEGNRDYRLHSCYIYNDNPLILKTIKAMKLLLNSDTRKKILIVNQ